MRKKECIAMILAGERGERLGALTNYTAKPTVFFRGTHRIIDFALSNCKHSGIDTIGVLTQYFSTDMHKYIHNGQAWNLNRDGGGIFMCPSGKDENEYNGTADAVYKNIAFMEQFSSDHVLILCGDHVYKMDYEKMLNFHKETGADVTIAATKVPHKEASRCEILDVDETGSILDFEDSPQKPRSNVASMGIYIFKWNALKKYLIADHSNQASQKDIGRNVIPAMLSAGESLYAHFFEGYWRDVGTVYSLWEANMDMIRKNPPFRLQDRAWEIFTSNKINPEYHMSSGATVSHSIISGACMIFGRVENSTLSDSVIIREGTEIIDSIIMSNVYIGKNVKINKAIIGSDVNIMDNVEIGAEYGTDMFVDRQICSKGISLVSPCTFIAAKSTFQKNSHIHRTALKHTAKPFRSCHFDYNFDSTFAGIKQPISVQAASED